ncbi:NifU family protein [Salibacteraceae bacterium]|jgi:Fe-S cluster biogenesis protein NfuA|nr:NifU family protein [Bacteroidota bacterium]MDB0058521.1 NifU family protein [Salibacteraceae bacterium]MDC1204701.1 NifU family protein [Salibacteraceae bacterium]
MENTVQSSLYQRVDEALNDLRVFVKEDGGDLELVEVTEEGIARVELKGACTSCSMNNMTFKAGVEEAIMKAVPEIQKVEAVGFQLNK